MQCIVASKSRFAKLKTAVETTTIGRKEAAKHAMDVARVTVLVIAANETMSSGEVTKLM